MRSLQYLKYLMTLINLKYSLISHQTRFDTWVTSHN